VKMSSRSGRLNARLKAHVDRYNSGLTRDTIDMDRFLDSSLAKSHSMGRHIYGTFWA
jgi:hypothetical protein